MYGVVLLPFALRPIVSVYMWPIVSVYMWPIVSVYMWPIVSVYMRTATWWQLSVPQCPEMQSGMRSNNHLQQFLGQQGSVI
jgi:hypothetical protein